MLTPMEIHDHQFKKSFRGYNENEVDDFLDKVVEDFEKLLRENERLTNLLNTAEKELDHYRKLEKTLNDTLMVAQRTADEVITSAKRNADELKENTARECQTIRERARLEAQQKIDSATTKRDAVLAEYDKFVREKNAFLMKLRTILESELTITVQMLDDMPQVDEAVKNILPEDETPAPVEDTSAPAEEPAPAPVEETVPPEKVPMPTDTAELTNIVDMASKPVAEEKAAVTDETRTFKPVKKNSSKGKSDKETAK